MGVTKYNAKWHCGNESILYDQSEINLDIIIHTYTLALSPTGGSRHQGGELRGSNSQEALRLSTLHLL